MRQERQKCITGAGTALVRAGISVHRPDCDQINFSAYDDVASIIETPRIGDGERTSGTSGLCARRRIGS
jgi:hypothetical protein